MKITTKARVAVRAMLELASHQRTGPVTLFRISERESVSISYLEQLFGLLRRHELVLSARGPGGGYLLSRTARNISVADIVLAVDNNSLSTRDDASEDISTDAQDWAVRLWANAESKVMAYLGSVSLQDLVDQQPPVYTKHVPIKRAYPNALLLPTSTLQKLTSDGVRAMPAKSNRANRISPTREPPY